MFLLLPFTANELWNNEVWECIGRFSTSSAERETEAQLVRKVPYDPRLVGKVNQSLN